MILDDKILYYLEYNPVNGCWHHDTGRAIPNTFNFYQISEKMDDFLFSVFSDLMNDKYKIKDTKEFPKHKNPSPEVIKKEWTYFLKVLDNVNHKMSVFSKSGLN